ncbi:MAG: tetratricopeptide repeat protein [Bacteroidota bacterium]
MSEHELWNELGNLYFMSGTYNQAAYAYHRSIQLDDGYGRPYCNLALTYVKQGRFAEAVDLYQRSIELLADDREKAITWYRLGDVYRHLKDYRDAILAYQQADLLDADLSQDRTESGQILYGGPEPRAGKAISVEAVNSESSAAAVEALPDPSQTAPAEDLVEAAEPTPAPPQEIIPEMETPAVEPVAEAAPAPAPADLDGGIRALDAAAGDLLPVEAVAEASPAVEDIPDPTCSSDIASELEPVAALSPAEEDMEPGPGEQMTPLPADPAEQEPAPLLEQMEEVETPPLEAADEVLTEPVPHVEAGELFVAEVSPQADPLPAEEAAVGDGQLPRYEETPDSFYESVPAPENDSFPPDPVAVSPEFEIAPSDEDAATAFIIPEEQEEEVPVVETLNDETQPEDRAEQDPVDPELQQIEAEIDRFRRVVQANPRNASAWDTLGTLYKSAQKYREAIMAYQQAASVEPSRAHYHHHLGILYAIEGREEEAIKAFQDVIELEPNHSLANASLGGYYRKMGLEELAQKHIGKAMKNFYSSENEYNRACMEALMGNTEQSIELLRVALKNKQTYVEWVLRDPDLDSIRRDPRFKQLISDYASW